MRPGGNAAYGFRCLAFLLFQGGKSCYKGRVRSFAGGLFQYLLLLGVDGIEIKVFEALEGQVQGRGGRGQEVFQLVGDGTQLFENLRQSGAAVHPGLALAVIT